MNEILWCERHQTNRTNRCFKEGTVGGAKYGPCPIVPMLLVPKDAPNIVVPGEWWTAQERDAWKRLPESKPAGRYVLVEQEGQ